MDHPPPPPPDPHPLHPPDHHHHELSPVSSKSGSYSSLGSSQEDIPLHDGDDGADDGGHDLPLLPPLHVIDHPDASPTPPSPAPASSHAPSQSQSQSSPPLQQHHPQYNNNQSSPFASSVPEADINPDPAITTHNKNKNKKVQPKKRHSHQHHQVHPMSTGPIDTAGSNGAVGVGNPQDIGKGSDDVTASAAGATVTLTIKTSPAGASGDGLCDLMTPDGDDDEDDTPYCDAKSDEPMKVLPASTNGLLHLPPTSKDTMADTDGPDDLIVDTDALIDRMLPRELLLQVFSHLDLISLCRCSQVSRTWNELALDGSNWQSVDLFFYQKDIDTRVMTRLSLRTGGFLHSLSLRGCRSLTDPALTLLCAACPNLMNLDLSDCSSLTDTTCAILSGHCTNLQSLNLSGLDNITDTSLMSLSTAAFITTRLLLFDVSFCRGLTANGLMTLLKGSPLTSPAVPNGSVSTSSAASYSGHQHDVAVHPLPLSHLRSFAAKNSTKLCSDGSIKQLVQRSGPHLKCLLLSNCGDLTDEAVSWIGSSCPNLHNLSLACCPRVTDVSLRSLSLGCPLLSTLELASCSLLTDSGLISLAKGCPLLTRLDLEEVVLMTDTTLTSLSMGCPLLHTLSLSHCELLSDEGIKSLVKSNHVLQILELDNCPLITDQGLHSLSQVTSLRRLEIYDCQEITRPGIKRLRSSLPSLMVHAYFAPVTPPVALNGHPGMMPAVGGGMVPPAPHVDPLLPVHPNESSPFCRCCSIL